MATSYNSVIIHSHLINQITPLISDFFCWIGCVFKIGMSIRYYLSNTLLVTSVCNVVNNKYLTVRAKYEDYQSFILHKSENFLWWETMLAQVFLF